MVRLVKSGGLSGADTNEEGNKQEAEVEVMHGGVIHGKGASWTAVPMRQGMPGRRLVRLLSCARRLLRFRGLFP